MSGCGDFAPWRGQRDVLLVRVDLDAGQECAVELPAYLRARYGVDRRSPLHECNGLFLGLLDLFGRLLHLREVLGLLVFLPNPVLLALEQDEWDGVGVGHLIQLAAFNIEAGEALPGPDRMISPSRTVTG